MPPRGERSVGARRGGAGASGILQAAVRRCRGPCAGCGPAGRCAVSAGAGGRGRGGGAAQAAAGPGEWSNLTAGTRRRRARGNGGGGGGAGRLREAWAVTRAPERGPMVLEGPRRPVLQVRRAPAEQLCVRGWERLAQPRSRLRAEARVPAMGPDRASGPGGCWWRARPRLPRRPAQRGLWTRRLPAPAPLLGPDPGASPQGSPGRLSRPPWRGGGRRRLPTSRPGEARGFLTGPVTRAKVAQEQRRWRRALCQPEHPGVLL